MTVCECCKINDANTECAVCSQKICSKDCKDTCVCGKTVCDCCYKESGLHNARCLEHRNAGSF